MKKMFEEILAKFEFWKAKNFVKLNKHYEFFLDLSNHETIAVKILKKYPGVIVEFTDVQMSTEHHLSYDLVLVANPNLCDVDSEKFKNFTARIFRNIIINSIEGAKKDNESRNSDPVESDPQRSIHEEVTAVFEERVSNRKPRKKTVRRNKAVRSEV